MPRFPEIKLRPDMYYLWLRARDIALEAELVDQEHRFAEHEAAMKGMHEYFEYRMINLERLFFLRGGYVGDRTTDRDGCD